jgi:hypothetical protein
MMTSRVSETTARGLPPRIRAAQAAIHLAEVQDMLSRLSKFGLGICMPHMHDELTGNFAPLSSGMMQVESGLKVSFESAGNVAMRAETFMPVGWAWSEGGPVAVAACEMVGGANTGGPNEIKHKM